MTVKSGNGSSSASRAEVATDQAVQANDESVPRSYDERDERAFNDGVERVRKAIGDLADQNPGLDLSHLGSAVEALQYPNGRPGNTDGGRQNRDQLGGTAQA